MRFSLAVAALSSLFASAVAVDHLVTVGLGGLKFNPEVITAAQGDTISFEFHPKNHTVTQSTFANPCQIQTTPAQGVDSGYQFVDATATTFAQWKITIDNATGPLWFFCAQGSHCAQGMVFAVNPNAEKTFEQFVLNAKSGVPPAGSASVPAPTGTGAGSTLNVPPSGVAGATGAALKTSFTMLATNAVTNLQGGPTPSLVAQNGSPNPSTVPNGAFSRIALPGMRTTGAVALFGLVAGLAL